MEDTRDTYTIVITLNDYKGMKLSFVHSNYFIRLFIAGDKMYIPVILVQLRRASFKFHYDPLCY